MNIYYRDIVSLLSDTYGFNVDTWRKEATLNLDDRTFIVFLPHDGPCEIYLYQLNKMTVSRVCHNAQNLNNFLQEFIPVTTPAA